MNNFDNFDDLVKKKMDGMEFPFSEENWQKAAQMIDASRHVAKKSVYKTIAIALIGISITGIAGYFIFTQFAHHNNKTIHADNSNGNEQVSAVAPHTENRTLTNAKNHLSENQVPIDNSISVVSANKETTSATEATGQQRQSTGSADLKISASNPVVNKKTDNAKKTTTQQNTNDKVISQNENQEENNIIVPVGEIENAKQKNTITNFEETEPLAQVEEKPLTNDNAIIESVQTSVQPVTADAPTAVNASTSAILQPDTANTIHVKRDYVRVKHHELIAEAGALNSFGWKVGNKRNGNSLTPMAGINYIYHFSHQSALLTGIQYNAISNLTESSVSFSVTSYNFGSKSDVTTFKLTELQQLVMPMKYLHTFQKKHTVGIGLNVSYLFNIKNRIESFKVIDGGVGTVSSKNDNGYGFDLCRAFNGQIAVSYAYRITDKLSVQAELHKTVLNLFNNYSVFNQKEANSKPSALKLSLTYSLFRK